MATQGYASSGGSVKHRLRAESRHGSGFVGSVSFFSGAESRRSEVEESSHNDECARF